MRSSNDETRALAHDLMDALVATKPKHIVKPWGWELVWRLDYGTLLKLIHVHSRERTSLQYHVDKEEVIYVLDGDGGVMDSNGKVLASEGNHVRITPRVIHRSVGPCTLLEVSTNHPEDVVRVEDDYDRV